MFAWGGNRNSNVENCVRTSLVSTRRDLKALKLAVPGATLRCQHPGASTSAIVGTTSLRIDALLAFTGRASGRGGPRRSGGNANPDPLPKNGDGHDLNCARSSQRPAGTRRIRHGRAAVAVMTPAQSNHQGIGSSKRPGGAQDSPVCFMRYCHENGGITASLEPGMSNPC
jgi:hypothetical protein